MLLPLQGESALVYLSPRAPLRSALGYAQVAPAGRTDGIIPPIITAQQGTDGIIPRRFSHPAKLVFSGKKTT